MVPHVLIFPFPAQGHVNPMLNLAELLCLSQLQVTFLNTNHYHHRLLRFTDAAIRFGRFPNFRFETIPDGLPDNHPRSFAANFKDVIDGINLVTKPSFRELLLSDRLKLVTCVIVDGLFTFPIDILKELAIPSISFRTTSACYLWAAFNYRNLVEAGQLPFPDDDMDKQITSIAGMESFLRRRDLPSFYRAKDLTDPFLEFITSAATISARASATILNTNEDLEGPVLSQMRLHFPSIYTIGPLHALLSSRLSISSPLSASSHSNSLWEVDRSCMEWLDSQPLKSVVYVSFGSIALMTHSQKMEFWHGLVNSGKRFLWVTRPKSVLDDEKESEIPVELREGTKERGCMVEWCPQEEVLRHQSVGGFVTHSGWNSTLESIVAGVPMVCWPYAADQQINSRFVGDVWKIGLDMKDTCDRWTVEKMVNDLMEYKRDDLKRSMDDISKRALTSVCQGGGSWSAVEALVEDIKTMKFKA